MPNTKRGKKPDVFSTNAAKRREITDADRHKVIVAILAGKSLLEAGREANVTRFDAEAIAGFAGWSNRARLEAARDRYAALAGVAS
jgi:hypothetical protein